MLKGEGKKIGGGGGSNCKFKALRNYPKSVANQQDKQSG